MDIVHTSSELERKDDLHLARLLILLRAFAEGGNAKQIEGLTKLAKLDFLLRYPPYLERALEARKKRPAQVAVEEYERRSIESRMVRFKYGPWDHRYRRLLNSLVGRGLVDIHLQGRTVHIALTAEGKAVADNLAATGHFASTINRAAIIRANFDLQGTTLMRFIYETFPEVVNLRYDEEI